jgi:hypothetical protein
MVPLRLPRQMLVQHHKLIQGRFFVTNILSNSQFTNDPTIRRHILRATLSLSLSVWLYSPLHLDCFFSFLILYTVGRTRAADQQGRYLHTE